MVVVDNRGTKITQLFFALSTSFMALATTDHWKVMKEWTSKEEYSPSVSLPVFTDICPLSS